jgi:hypothetical protein
MACTLARQLDEPLLVPGKSAERTEKLRSLFWLLEEGEIFFRHYSTSKSASEPMTEEVMLQDMQG